MLIAWVTVGDLAWRWRAMHGPEQDVIFPQDHQPGQLGAFDFTHCEELGVTIAGVIFIHLMFQFVLAWSGWRHIAIALGETYEALLWGLQGAFWELRGVQPACGSACCSYIPDLAHATLSWTPARCCTTWAASCATVCRSAPSPSTM